MQLTCAGIAPAKTVLLLLPYRRVPLSEGRIESDGTLMCCYHGWRFNGEGQAVAIPAVCFFRHLNFVNHSGPLLQLFNLSKRLTVQQHLEGALPQFYTNMQKPSERLAFLKFLLWFCRLQTIPSRNTAFATIPVRR